MCKVCSFSQRTVDSRTYYSTYRYNQVISIDNLLPDRKLGKARLKMGNRGLPDEAPPLPDEGMCIFGCLGTITHPN